MKSMLKYTFLGCLVAVLAAGCAGMGKGPTDQELVQGQLDKLKVALEGQDLDALMALFSDEFYHPEVGGKEEGRALLEMGINMGYADDGKVDMEEAEITIEGDTATVYPVEASSAAGAVTIEVILKKEAAGWLVRELNVEGV